mgnify:CR=1 FL=1
MIEPEAGLLPREIAEKNEKLWRVSIMTKTDLIAQVAANTEMSKKSAEAAVNAVFDALSKGMAAGEKITISGFGTFEVRERAERQGINPRTRGHHDRGFPQYRVQAGQGSEGYSVNIAVRRRNVCARRLFIALRKPLLQGEVALRSNDGEVGQAAFSLGADSCKTSQSASQTAPLLGEPLAKNETETAI